MSVARLSDLADFPQNFFGKIEKKIIEKNSFVYRMCSYREKIYLSYVRCETTTSVFFWLDKPGKI